MKMVKITKESFLYRLHEEFPQHMFSIRSVYTEESFEVKNVLVIDGNISDIRWTPERVQDVKAMNGNVIEEKLEKQIMEQVREFFDEQFNIIRYVVNSPTRGFLRWADGETSRWTREIKDAYYFSTVTDAMQCFAAAAAADGPYQFPTDACIDKIELVPQSPAVKKRKEKI